MLLQISNVSKRFGGVAALEDISLDICSGESVGIIGPNGSGKTTLFNVISGFVRPDRGEVRFEGDDLLRLPPHKIPRLGIARMFQVPQLSFDLSILENVAIATYQSQQKSSAFAMSSWLTMLGVEMAVSAAETVGLTKQLNLLPSALTNFERRKVELARSLVARPKLLLLDEPTSGFSASERDDFAKLVDHVADLGSSMLIIEHDLTLIHRTCERVVVLDAGKKIAEGNPQGVSQDKAVSEVYIGPLHVAR